jgi:hypothetical protein
MDSNGSGPSSHNENVLQFFLNLYKYQLGASHSDDDPSEIVPLSSDNYGKEFTYELRVERQGKLKSRRMALGLMEESSGSKSTCFKVVYDDVLVVKIPPHPIIDFDKYIERINIERRIAEKLSSGIECIAPSVSALLKRIPRFSDNEGLTPEELEKKYIIWLKRFPRLQEHLKIGKTFAFFMNLSKHSFFSSEIAKLHAIEAEIQKEILCNYDTLWNLELFEDRYGLDNTSAFFSINEVFAGYEKEITPLLDQYGIVASIPPHTRKEWLLNYLAKNEIKKTNGDAPSGFYEDLNSTLDQLFEDQKEKINDYRETIKKCIRNKNFDQNKSQFRGVIANLLELLSHLNQRGVAIRDLKPENIFLAAGPNRSSLFLASAGQYSLGLIDFETAVDFTENDQQNIEQPLLAGTPYYATPSHVFENELLHITYHDLASVLYFQDWYAAIGIIYNVITGKQLFEKTGKFLPEIIKLKYEAAKNGEQLQELFNKSTRVFWPAAGREFQEKIKANEEILKSVKAAISKNSVEMIKKEVLKINELMMESIRKRVSSQNIFKSKKSHQGLIRSSCAAISRCRTNWKMGYNIPKTRRSIRRQIIEILGDLEQLKLKLKQQRQGVKVLEMKPPRLSVYELLELMFNIVASFMYQKEKMVATSDDFRATRVEKVEISEAETVACEATLMADG